MTAILRSLLLLSFLVFTAQVSYAQCLNCPPLAEDFDDETNCSTSCGASCTITNSLWKNVGGDNGDWAVDNGGTGSSSTGPSKDTTSATGSGNYIYLEASSPCYGGDTYFLESPCFGVPSGATMDFVFFYHMYGQSMGTLHLDYRTSPTAPWTMDLIPPISDNIDRWQEMSVSLAQFQGQTQLQLRFRGVSGSNFYSDMALDGLRFESNSGDNVKMVDITSPSSGCGLTSTEQVTAVAENASGGIIPAGTSIDWELKLDGNQVVVDQVSLGSAWAPGTQINHTFSQTLDLSTFGEYQIEAVINHAPDKFCPDDAFVRIVENKTLNAFPRLETFEGQSECSISNCTGTCDFEALWMNSRTDSSDWITEKGPTTTANTGPPVDHTTGNTSGVYVYLENNVALTCAGKIADLESNCIDFTNALAPQLEFWYHMFGTTMGTMQVDISTNGGNTYSTLVPPFTDNQDLWQQQTVDLSAYAGQNQIKIRFRGILGPSTSSDMALDDILLVDKGGEDLAVTAILSPGSGCGLNKENVEITLENEGTVAVSSGTNIPVSYSYSGNPTVNENITLSSDLQPGQSINYTFSTQVQINPGSSVLFAEVNHGPDPNSLNDEKSKTIRNESSTSGPAITDFESYSTCGTSCSSTCSFTGLFENATYDDIDWLVDKDGTPSTSTGPSGDHTTGTGNYIYTESSSCYSKTAILEARCQDFSAMVSPTLDFWYHMYGTSQGTLHVDVKVGEDPWTEDVIPALTGNADQWINQTVDLSAYAGEPSVSVRLRGVTGTSTSSDMALDDISLIDAGDVDLEMTNLISPVTGCGLSDQEQVQIEFTNTSNQTVQAGTTIQMGYVLDGNLITENHSLSLPLLGGTSQTYTFTNQADFSSPGLHDFRVFLNLPADGNQLNDTIFADIANLTISTFPYTSDFDNEPDCFYRFNCYRDPCDFVGLWQNNHDGVSDSADWYAAFGDNYGSNTGPSGDVDGSGSYLYVEGSSCSNRSALLESPCIDFTNNSNPGLAFYYHMWGSNMGYITVSISTNGGLTYTQLDKFTDNQNLWQLKVIGLPAYAGEPNVRIRIKGDPDGTYSNMAIDEITLFEKPAEDLALTGFFSPADGCGLTANETVTVEITHEGSNTIPTGTRIPMEFEFQGTTYLDTLVLTSDFLPTTTLNFSFSQTINASAGGTYNLTAEVKHVNDGFTQNDANTYTFANQSNPPLPYTEDFSGNSNGSTSCTGSQTLNGFWENVSGDDKDWVARSSSTSSTATGPSSDHTGGGHYIYLEGSSCYSKTALLEAKCIDLTNVASPILNFWLHMYGESMGTLSVDVNDGTGWQNDVFGPFTDDKNQWQEKLVNLGQFAGQIISIRFRGITGTNFYTDMALDDITIADAGTQNVFVQDVLSPLSGCGNNDAMPVEILVRNDGTQDIPAGDTLVLSYTFKGVTTSDTLILTSPFAAGSNMNYTFTSTVDASAYGNYNFDVTAFYSGDLFHQDDTKDADFTGETIGVFPLIEDFGQQPNRSNSCTAATPPDFDGIWVNVDSTDDMNWTTYNRGISPTTTGPEFDHTGGGSYLYTRVSTITCVLYQADIISPCINLVNAENPKLDFWYYLYGQGMGQIQVLAVVDGGQEQILVPSITDSVQEWKNYVVDLDQFIGEDDLRLIIRSIGGATVQSDVAVDDILIADFGFEDIELTQIISPSQSGCGLGSSEQVEVEITQTGSRTVTSGTDIPMTLDFDGTIYRDTLTLTSDFDPGNTLTFTFGQTLDLSNFGSYTIKASVNHTGDTYAGNDTLATSISSRTVRQYPVTEDFDAESQCGTSCSSTCDLVSEMWVNVGGDDKDWLSDRANTGSSNTGPSADHTQGNSTGFFVYTEGSSCYGQTSILESACFDLTNGQNPSLEFWYHMYGAAMGYLHLDAQVNGGAWQNDIIDSITGNVNAWQFKAVDLKPYNGSVLKLRFRGVTGTSLTTDMALDDILVQDRGSSDFEAVDILGLDGGCSNDPNTQVSLRMVYYGNTLPAGQTLAMEQEVNGTVYSENWVTNSSIKDGDTVVYTFNRTVDLSSPGITNITLRGVHPAEIALLNNEASGRAEFIQPNFSTVYDFESESTCSVACGADCNLTGLWQNTDADDIDWAADVGGTSSSGTGPSVDHTKGNSSGVYLYTEASGCTNREAHLISPCLDLSTFGQAGLELWYHMYGDQMGTLHLDAFQDGVWKMDVGAPITDNANEWKQGTFAISRVDLSRPVILRLRGKTGGGFESDMAIDDIGFTEVAGTDLRVTNLLRPYSGCLAASEAQVEMEMQNKGNITFPAGDTIKVSYFFDGDRSEEMIVLANDFFPGQYLNHTFNQPIFVDEVGNYSIELTASNRKDEAPGNDTLVEQFKNETVRAFPFTEDFESETNCATNCGTDCATNGFWNNVYNDENDWIAYSGSTPTGNTGPSFDHTTGNASGHYMYFEGNGCSNENAFLVGPCLDFTNSEDVFIEFWYHMYGSSMGTMSLDVKIGGGFWFFDYVPSWTDNTNGWVKKRILLPGLRNRSNVRIRFRATGGNGTLSDMAIDDITIMACKKPEITTPTGLFTACKGDSLKLRVRPSNATTITWFKDGQVLAGADSAVLLLREADTGYYYVQTDYPYNCSRISDSIHFTIVDIPNDPEVLADGNLKICPGGDLNLSSSGTASFYQWYKNGNPIGGADQNNLTVSTPGIYQVELWDNPSCKAMSDSAQVSIAPAAEKPEFTAPDGVFGCPGDSVKLLAESGYSSYDWVRNGQTVVAESGNVFYAHQPGNYQVRVYTENGCDTISSIIQVHFTFQGGFDIQAQGPTSFCEGDKVILESNPASSIQWFVNGQAIQGAKTSAFAARDPGDYFAVAEESGCTDTSSTINVQVIPRPNKPMITPKDTATCDGGPVTLTASNTSGSIQWFKDGHVISGATGNQITVTQTGSYSIQLTNASGCVNSDTSFYANFLSGGVQASVTDSIICTGKKVEITSSIPFGNQWYFNGSSISGATNQSVWVDAPGDYYTIVVKDSCTDTSNTITLTQTFGQSKPVITNHGDSIICNGGSTLLQSTNAVQYQWTLDGVHIPGAQSEFYTAIDPGEYSLIATNQFGCQDTADPVFIFEHPTVDLSVISITDNACSGNEEGEVQLGVSGGSPTYSFSLNMSTWQTQPEFLNLATGDYWAYVEDANGCLDSVQFSIDHGGNDLDLQFAFDPILCFDDSTNLYVSGSGGQPPYTYSLNGSGFKDDDILRAKAGNHLLQIKDFNGCIVESDSISISQPTELIGNSFIEQEVLCFDGSSGILSATGQGGTPPYAYSIDGGSSFQSSNIFGNLGPGVYQILVQDDFGCLAETPIQTLDEPDLLEITSVDVVQDSVSCFGIQDGKAIVQVTGGTPPYSYSIDGANFNGSAFFGNLPADSIQFTVRDENNCEALSNWIFIGEPDSIYGSATVVKHVDCFGYATGRLQVAAQGGTGNLEYAIDLVNYQSSPIFDSLLARTYDNITVRDENGCVVFLDPVTITQPDPFTASGILTPITCQGQNNATIEIQALGGSRPFTFSIDGGQNFTSDSVFTNLGPGTYDLDVLDASGCLAQVSDNVVIEDPALFALDSIQVTHVGCFGQSNGVISVLLNGGVPPFEYSIDGGVSFGNNPIISGLAADTFDIVVRDANGCSLNLGQKTILQPPAISASASLVQAVSCHGGSDGSVQVAATGGNGGFSYSIDGGQTFTGNPVFTGLASATYSILVKDVSDCQVSVSVQVGQPLPLQTGNLQVQQISCFGANDGRITLTATGGTGQRSFSIDGGQSFQTNGIFANLGPGTYTLVVNDINACQTTPQVIQINEPDSIFGQTVLVQAIVCGGTATGSIMAQVQGGTPPFTYSINGAPAVSDSVFDQLTAGTYGITATDVNGCVIQLDSIIITQPQALVGTGTVTQHVSCHDANDGVITLSAGGGGGNYTYSIDGASWGPSNVFTGLPAGTYIFFVQDANGCISQIGPIEIIDQNPLLLNVVQTADVSCYGDADGQITANAQGGNGVRQFNLNGGPWTLVSVFQNLGAGTYVVGVQDAIGCERYDTLVVNQPDSLSPSLDLKFVPNPGDNNGYIRIDLTGGTAPYTYKWSNGATTQDIFSLTRGVYTVEITDANGCKTFYTVDLTQYGIGIEQEEMSFAIFPNPAQTQFTIQVKGYAGEMDIEVYNALGEVYYRADALTISKDGNRIQASGWPAGMYTVKVMTDGFTQVRNVLLID